MAIETTISIKNVHIEKLFIIALKRKISMSAVIRDIILMLSKEQEKFIRFRFTTEYQTKDKGAYKRLHIYLNEPYYEQALDLRRFYRASLSLLIAEALELLYEEILSLVYHIDNYPGLMHTMIYYETGNSMVWKHIWGDVVEGEIIKPHTG